MPQGFPSNTNVEEERRSLLSLGNLRRIASFKRVIARIDTPAKQPVSREKTKREMTHETEPAPL
jgi:hypothetical protein